MSKRIIIIGSGPGGHQDAVSAAQLGATVEDLASTIHAQ